MTALLINPNKKSVEKITLPSRNDRVLRLSIASAIGCQYFEFQVEFYNDDVVAVDSMGHLAARTRPFKILDKPVLFGKAVVLGTDRFAQVLTNAVTLPSELVSRITFYSQKEEHEMLRKLQGIPSLVKPIRFKPPF